VLSEVLAFEVFTISNRCAIPYFFVKLLICKDFVAISGDGASGFPDFEALRYEMAESLERQQYI